VEIYIAGGAAVALAVMAAVLFFTRPGRNSPPEVKDAAKVLTSRKCTGCNGPVVIDMMDDGATAFLNCVNPACGNRFVITDLDYEER